MKRRKIAPKEDDDEDGVNAEPPPPPRDWEASEDDEDERPDLAIQSLVVGGRAAAPGQFPFQAGLVVTIVGDGPPGEQGGAAHTARCGAALISDRWLLTAAHCCRRGKRIRVFLGSHLTMKDSQQKVDSALVLLHPLYSSNMPGHHDLALIRLPRPVRFTDKVRPVRLPSFRHTAEDFAGRVATLSGWGKTSDLDERPRKGTAVLRFARERVLAHDEAEKIFERKLPPYFLCVRGLQGEVSCNGDSGGPLTVEDDHGRPMLVGVVSHRYGVLCGTSKAHVCTRVTSYLPWIASVSRVAIEH